MEVKYKYYKNSNTGDLLRSQEFISQTPIEFPTIWSDINNDVIGYDIPLPSGYVEISEKKYNRIKKKIKNEINRTSKENN